MPDQINIKYFGVVAEVTGKSEENFNLANASSISDVITQCKEKYPELENISFKVASNKKLMIDGPVHINDELALLPPFSGG